MEIVDMITFGFPLILVVRFVVKDGTKRRLGGRENRWSEHGRAGDGRVRTYG